MLTAPTHSNVFKYDMASDNVFWISGLAFVAEPGRQKLHKQPHKQLNNAAHESRSKASSK